MTARVPLYYDGSDLREMTPAEIGEWQDRAIYQYSLSPTVALSVVFDTGNVGAMTDSRLAAGDWRNSVSAYPSEAVTPEPITVNITFNKILQTRSSAGVISETVDTGIAYPIYNDSGNIRAMNLVDFKDTFIYPAIDKMIVGAESNTTAGTYTISTSSSLVDYTLVSATPVFTDTRANTALYTAAGIPEAIDQPMNITNYYLHRRNGVSVEPTRKLMYINSSSNLRDFTIATGATLLGEWLRYVAALDIGNRLSYNIATPGLGNARGTSMVDTKLNGSGAYNIRYVNANDYRAQEFPNGTAVTINTYTLGISKA